MSDSKIIESIIIAFGLIAAAKSLDFKVSVNVTDKPIITSCDADADIQNTLRSEYVGSHDN